MFPTSVKTKIKAYLMLCSKSGKFGNSAPYHGDEVLSTNSTPGNLQVSALKCAPVLILCLIFWESNGTTANCLRIAEVVGEFPWNLECWSYFSVFEISKALDTLPSGYTCALVLSLGCLEKIFLIVYRKELLHPTIKTWRNNQEIWDPKYTCYFDLNPNASALVTLRTG